MSGSSKSEQDGLMANRMSRVLAGGIKQVLSVALSLFILGAMITGCVDQTPPLILEETVDLSQESLNGQWDVQLEIWVSGDRTNVYHEQLRFNLTENPAGVFGFSVYRVSADPEPARFSHLPGFQPEYVDYYGEFSIEGSDMVYIWFDSHPEYQFKTYLVKDSDGRMVGSGNAISLDQTGETLATLQIVQTRRW